MITRISVTEKDIQNGDPLNSSGCPVALAIIRRVDKKYKVAVSSESVSIYSPKHEEVWFVKTPAKVKYFIDNFDEDRDSVDPMTFKIDLPEELAA
jgi:hypothetical protein